MNKHVIGITFTWGDDELPTGINLSQIGPVLGDEDLAAVLFYLASRIGTDAVKQHHFQSGPPHPGYPSVH